jgi:hypothetical protein
MPIRQYLLQGSAFEPEAISKAQLQRRKPADLTHGLHSSMRGSARLERRPLDTAKVIWPIECVLWRLRENPRAAELIEKADELDKMIDAELWDTEQVLGAWLARPPKRWPYKDYCDSQSP